MMMVWKGLRLLIKASVAMELLLYLVENTRKND